MSGSEQVCDNERQTTTGTVVDHPASPADTDVLVLDLGRHGLRARRTGITPPLRIDPPRRARHTRPEHMDTEAVLATLLPLLTAVSTPPLHVVASVREAGRLVDPDGLRARLAAAAGAPAVVCDSLFTTLVGARGEVTPGVVLDMGTSTVGLATDLRDTWHRIDGWGPLLGDRGSGAWLGAQGLSAALRARDGVPGGSTLLLQSGRAMFGDESGWPALVHGEDGAQALADFGPAVGEASRQGDDVAQAIVRLAGEHLADTLMAGKDLLPGEHITATGDLLLVEAVKVSLASALGKRFQVIVPALADSLDGAHLLARHLAGGGLLPHRPPFVWTGAQNALGT